jgi:serine/threonine-protein kinase
LDAAGNPRVADFGLARILPADASRSYEQGIVGNFPYIAPEMVEGQFSRLSDVYGLGAILYEMLTGRPPFRGETPLDTIHQVVEMEPVPPRKLNPSVDPDLQYICMKCLEKKPEYRYASAADLAADLQHYLNGEQIPGLGLWEWARRQITYTAHFEQLALWGRIVHWLALYSLMGHTLMYILLRSGPSTGLCWLWFFGFELGGKLIPWFSLRSERRLDRMERGLLLHWVGGVIADLLLFSLFCPPFGTAVPETVVQVYPAWMTVHGLMWFMEARLYWGRFYLVGLGFFAAVPVLSHWAEVSPLLFGLVNGAALTWLGFGVRRLAREQAERPRLK